MIDYYWLSWYRGDARLLYVQLLRNCLCASMQPTNALTFGRAPESSLDELVEKNWHNLLEASLSGQFVQVVDEPLSGIVFAEKRQEPYMGFDIGVLSWIYVDPAARGQGVSRRLMEAAHAWMDEQGVRGRQVFVTATNEAAVKLYQRYGYSVVDYRMLATVD